MSDERAFDFRRAHAMTRNIDHIVDASGDPVIAVGVATAAVAGEIFAGIGGEIGLLETFMVAIDSAHLPRPAIGDDQIALAGASITLPVSSTICGRTPKKGRVAEPGFRAVAPGSGVINMPPVSVCHQVSTIGHRSSPTTR